MIKHLLVHLESALVENSCVWIILIHHDETALLPDRQSVADDARLEGSAHVRSSEHVSTLYLRGLLHVKVHALLGLLEEILLLQVG